jgi:hypothetical protein
MLTAVAEMLLNCRAAPEQILDKAIAALDGSLVSESFQSVSATRAVVKATLAYNRELAQSQIQEAPQDPVKQQSFRHGPADMLPWLERAVHFLRRVLGYSRRDTALLIGLSDAHIDQLYEAAEKRVRHFSHASFAPQKQVLKSMDTSFAPPQRSAALLPNEVVYELSNHSTPFFPDSCLPARNSTAYYAEASSWSLSGFKRCIDFVFALVALLISWPLFLLAAILVCYESPGPVIFRQKRVGLDGVPFTVFKFRTMSLGAQEDGPCLTKRGDRRITRFGGFLRKYKLDELPQLVNDCAGT